MTKVNYIPFLLIFTTLFSIPSRKEYSDAFVKTAKIGSPAVVSIISEKKINSDYHQFLMPFGNQFYDNDKFIEGFDWVGINCDACHAGWGYSSKNGDTVENIIKKLNYHDLHN